MKIMVQRNDSRKITAPQSLNAYVKGIYDIMCRSDGVGVFQYVDSRA